MSDVADTLKTKCTLSRGGVSYVYFSLPEAPGYIGDITRKRVRTAVCTPPHGRRRMT